MRMAGSSEDRRAGRGLRQRLLPLMEQQQYAEELPNLHRPGLSRSVGRFCYGAGSGGNHTYRGEELLPRYITAAFKIANGLGALGAFSAWGTLVGRFLRAGGIPYRYAFSVGMVIGLGIAFFALRELDGLRQSKNGIVGNTPC